jgi:RNA polymerase sigma factor (TIGR02999 family)
VNDQVFQLFQRLRTGDSTALGELTPTLYAELRHIASRHLHGERPGHTLQATALVNEAYLKLAGGSLESFVDKTHFLAVASRVMRQVLVDYARSRASQKRGGDVVAPLWDAQLEVKDESGGDIVDLIVLNDALDALAAESATKAQLIEMRFFGGMTAEEIAAALEMSVHVVRHELRFAQAWLRRRLSD